MAETNPMKQIEIEKVVLNCGGTDEKLERSTRLLNLLSNGRKVKQTISTKRIPAFGVRPGLKTGCTVTIRSKEKIELLKGFLIAVNNQIKKKQIVKNQFSFGIKEYLEIPDVEYKREIGILGLEVTVVFKKKGKRTGIKKYKKGKVPARQHVSKEDISEYLTNKLNVEII